MFIITFLFITGYSWIVLHLFSAYTKQFYPLKTIFFFFPEEHYFFTAQHRDNCNIYQTLFILSDWQIYNLKVVFCLTISLCVYVVIYDTFLQLVIQMLLQRNNNFKTSVMCQNPIIFLSSFKHCTLVEHYHVWNINW